MKNPFEIPKEAVLHYFVFTDLEVDKEYYIGGEYLFSEINNRLIFNLRSMFFKEQTEGDFVCKKISVSGAYYLAVKNEENTKSILCLESVDLNHGLPRDDSGNILYLPALFYKDDEELTEKINLLKILLSKRNNVGDLGDVYYSENPKDFEDGESEEDLSSKSTEDLKKMHDSNSKKEIWEIVSKISEEFKKRGIRYPEE